MAAEQTRCDIEEFIEDFCEQYEDMADARGINFSYGADSDFIYCDKEAVGQMLESIILNAFKYTSEGGMVDVDLESVPNEKDGWVTHRITVSDNGVGIERPYMLKIFDDDRPAYDYDAFSDQFLDTKLNLVEIRKMAEEAGGKISVASKLGSGSVFTLTLPHKLAE